MNYLKELFAENESELQTYISSIGIKALKKANEVIFSLVNVSSYFLIDFETGTWWFIQNHHKFCSKQFFSDSGNKNIWKKVIIKKSIEKNFFFRIKNLYKNLTKTKEEKELNETEMVLKKRVHSELDGKEVSSHSNPSKHLKIESI